MQMQIVKIKKCGVRGCKNVRIAIIRLKDGGVDLCEYHYKSIMRLE